MGYEYYPMSTGKFCSFEVREVHHDKALNQHDTTRYQLKEVVGQPFIDLEGDTAYKLLRYIRQSDSAPWQVQDVWSVKRNAYALEVNRENQRVIALAFRAVAGKSWDLNAQNTSWPLYLRYQSVDEPREVSGALYPQAADVGISPDLTLISYRTYFTRYVKDVGVVYHHEKDLEINNFDTTDIESGWEILYQLMDHGSE